MSYWDLEEGGGGLNGARGVVTDTFFTEGDYGWQWIIKTKFDDPENWPKFEDGTFTLYLGLPPGWLSKDGGETVVHESGDESKRYNKGSKVGRFITQLAKIGAQEELPDFNPYVAASVKGIHWECANVPFSKRAPKEVDGKRVLDAQGKEIWEDVPGATELMPVKILGGEEKVAEPVDISDLDLTSEQIAALGAAKSDSDFMAVLMAEGLTSNTKVMALVSGNLAGFRAALPF